MLYGQFVGHWTTSTTAWQADGSCEESTWDVHFAWVLEGRAVQDLWITPPRRQDRRIGWDEPLNRYSTTLRIFDPAEAGWHILWVNPPTGSIVRQFGRKVGDEIVQIGAPDGHGVISRWVYRDIRRDAFRWCNERSADGGSTWQLVQEMQARRTP